MDASGRPHEGWISVIPLAVLVAIVVVAMGGPTAFVNTVGGWMNDVLSSLVTWLNWL